MNLRATYRRIVITFAAVIVAALVLVACATPTQTGPQVTTPEPASTLTTPETADPTRADLGPATIRTSFQASGQYCYLYLAEALGYFEEEGLDANIEEGDNSVQAIQTVATGRDFMSAPSLDALPSIVAQGADVVAVAALQQEAPAGIIVHRDSGIESPPDLAGARILTGPGTAAALLEPYLTANGVEPTSVEIINTDHGTKFQTFIAGDGDSATIFSTGELPVMRAILEGDVDFFPYSDVFDMYGLGLVVSRQSIEERPEAVAAAVRAILRAEQHSLENPQDCVDAVIDAFPDREIDADVTLGQVEEHQALLTAGGDELGIMSDERWAALEDLLVEHVGLEERAGSVSDYYTNEFLP